MRISSSRFVLIGGISVDIAFLPCVVDLAGFGGAWLGGLSGWLWWGLALGRGTWAGGLFGWLWWGLPLVGLGFGGFVWLALVVCLVGLGCGLGWLW